MGIRRGGGKDYEEMPGTNIPVNGTLTQIQTDQPIMGQEFELASVSVVPDGEFNIIIFPLNNQLCIKLLNK